ncbi:MAG: zinc ribbon domain-containing protein [Acidobacteria bacterium]|nr:zinc ribbon domain-containing protein [Acidobacteriota bacterium]
MDEKLRCQSCGMPIDAAFSNLGTNEDESSSTEYCKFCFHNGRFTNPDQTLAEMIQSSIDNMTSDLGMTVGQASELANSFIPSLRRWQKD